ncbi:MAG: ATP-binding protein [Ignavibacteriae bacterium]|nr:ATP-binding protein [Ignavibacteriota bacterium]
MAKIHTLKIANYRGFKKFEQVFGMTDFICLIGRGDSGKTTILEAISSVLSPIWNLSFYDTDFYKVEITNPIEIEVSLYELPNALIHENKFGLYIRGLDKATGIIHDEIKDEHEPVLTIKLIVKKDLEPKWFVTNDRNGQEPIEIHATDRAKLNVFMVSDYIDRHFTWNKGTPLYSLLKQDGSNEEKTSIIVDAFRDAKQNIDPDAFKYLNNVVKNIKKSASNLGVDIENTSTSIDFKDIAIKDGRICLHEDNVPFRLKGKGTKRLISVAIQTELAKSGGILLIDEIELGLEPDRAQHLVRTLKKPNIGQVFITTHSRDILVELKATDIYKIEKNGECLLLFDTTLQGCIRTNPEAFFSNRILVCEGPTEIGICRGLNNYRIQSEQDNVSYLGVGFANGVGSNQVAYAKGFLEAGYKVCMFCDSEVKEFNEQKATLKEKGINIIDCDNNNAIENQIFLDLPWNAIKELIHYVLSTRHDSVEDSLRHYYKTYGELPQNWIEVDSLELRKTLGIVAKKRQWLKNIDHGEFLGEVCCKYLADIKGTRLETQFQELSDWIDNA